MILLHLKLSAGMPSFLAKWMTLMKDLAVVLPLHTTSSFPCLPFKNSKGKGAI